MAYYVFDDAKNLFEGMTKEEIIAAIAQATGVTPASIDDGFITTIQEQNAQHGVKLWVGSQNEYNAIQQPDANTLYIVTDPAETNELQNQINQLQSEMNTLVAQNTTNASGYKVEAQETDPITPIYNEAGNYYYIYHAFTVPENSIILEAGFRIAMPNTVINVVPYGVNGTTVNVLVTSEKFTIESEEHYKIKIVYAYSDTVDLSELTDIRVGYDGTVYGSAGEAVRKQAFDTRFHDYIKQALLNLLRHVAYIDGNGQQYYNELEAAMYMLAGVTSITAVFNQGENVIYNTDDLDTLRQYLTVTAYYEDGTHDNTNAYTLSGSLEVGTSTITVSYGGKTATISVTVTDNPVYGFVEVGNPSIVNNVLYPADSNGGYIRSKREFSPAGTWKIRMKMKVNNENAARNVGMTADQNGDRIRSIQTQIIPTTGQYGLQWLFYLSSDGTNWDIVLSKGLTNLVSGTVYYAEFEFTGSQYNYRWSTDGQTWTDTANPVESTSKIYGEGYLCIGCPQGTTVQATNSPIYLEELKVWQDGELWWQAVR